MTSLRFVFLAVSVLALLALSSGCASTTTLPVAVVASDHPAADAVDERSAPIAVKRTGDKPYDFVLVRNDRAVAEAQFRGLYREVFHTSELDTLVKKRARDKTLTTVAIGSGMTLLGVGTIALAALPSSQCAKAPKCPEGVVSAALIGGYGAYILGCMAVEGTRCIADGHVVVRGVGLTREEAERYVTKYDQALASRL